MHYIQLYDNQHRTQWDDFVANSKNGTFLFLRDYMEYHADRFQDHSFMIYDDKNQLLALLPAHKTENRLDTHGGLTYGGFITNETMKIPHMLGIMDALITYCRQQAIQAIRYKTIPHIYHRLPAEEDLYALYLCNAKLVSRSVITALQPTHRPAFQTQRQRAVKKALKHGLEVKQSHDWTTYWIMLSALLASAHDARPVHTLTEIIALHQAFPQNIKLYATFENDAMIAGIVIYESDTVARCQYIATNPRGREIGALDYLMQQLFDDIYSTKTYIDLGTSEISGTPNYVNTGLISQKEGFGARAIMQDQYMIQLDEVNQTALTEALT